MNEWYNGGICGDCACIPVCMIYSATGGVTQCKYKVMYVFIRGIEYDSTGMSVLVNTDGTPMVWEGE